MNLPSLQNIAIVGPGLLGGSLLLALREKLPHAHLRVWARRPEAAERVRALQLAEVTSTSLHTVVQGANLVVLCTPVETMKQLALELIAGSPAIGCVVTDVGSVKGSVVSGLEDVFSRSSCRFVGSHPMAGSEKTGLEAARADLFVNAACLLTPTLFTVEEALQQIRDFWTMLGCRVMEMSPEEHDRKVARISHLPHLAAAAVTLAALHDDPGAAACAGKGFRDSTRVASGDAGLWTGIVLENRAEVVEALRDARDRFDELLAIMENMDDRAIHRFLADAKSLRDAVS